jgi:hypothetical protein
MADEQSCGGILCGKYFIAGFHEAFAKTGSSLWIKRPKEEDPKGTISL